MPRSQDYKCTVCGNKKPKDQLLVKKVSFNRIGEGGRTVRSRSVAWLCMDSCLKEDADWNREAYTETQGFKPASDTVNRRMKANGT